MESWHASPVPLSQYIALSAMIGWLPVTLVERSVSGRTSFTLIVLRESAGMVKVAWGTAPDDVM